MIHLDASHRCVLENWRTVEKMVSCSRDLATYLQEVARAAFKRIQTRRPGQLDLDDRLKKEYIQVLPTKLASSKRKSPAIVIGLEGITVRRVITPNADEACYGFIYSPLRADTAVPDAVTAGFASLVTSSNGLALKLDSPERGYLLKEQIPPIGVEDFAQANVLDTHIDAAVERLVNWYFANEQTIVKALR